MANVKNYGLKGIGNDVQFGKGGGRLVYDTSSSFFKFTTDGTTLSQARVATTPSNANDAASKSYVCLLYTFPSPRDQRGSRMPSSA